MPSDFQSRLRLFPVSLVMERIGCKQAAVYGWQAGTRLPEPWQQAMILEKLGDPPAPAVDGETKRDRRGRPRKAIG